MDASMDPGPLRNVLTTPHPPPRAFASILTPGSGYPHPPDSTPFKPRAVYTHSP